MHRRESGGGQGSQYTLGLFAQSGPAKGSVRALIIDDRKALTCSPPAKPSPRWSASFSVRRRLDGLHWHPKLLPFLRERRGGRRGERRRVVTTVSLGVRTA